MLQLESQIDTSGSNVTDSGEIGNHSITMLSTVNYRLNRLIIPVPDDSRRASYLDRGEEIA